MTPAATETSVAPPGGPPDPAFWGNERERIDSAPRLLGLALIGGVALDVGLRGGITNLFVTLGLLIAAVLVLSVASTSTESRWLAALSLVPAALLSLRASPWLAVANTGAAVGLLAAATIFSRTGSPLDASMRELAARFFHAAGRGLSRVVPLVAMIPRPRSDTARVARRSARAVLLALPLLVALVGLLATADVVFANLIAPDIDAAPALSHIALALALMGVLVVLGLAVGAEPEPHERTGTFGVAEIGTVLGLAAGILGLFVVSQLVALTDAGQRLIQDAGLTPAEYARSGFFQLCWASLVVVGYLALARYLAEPGVFAARVVRGLSAAVPLLAVGLVVVSLRRMVLYDRAFGLTMLRLSVVVASIWIGIVLALIAARNLGVHARREWVPGAAIAAAVVLVVTATLLNPEAFVVRHNLARAAEGASVDTVYLARLSDDAVPAIATGLERAGDDDLRRRLEHALGCGRDGTGVAALNVSAAAAARVRTEHCPDG